MKGLTEQPAWMPSKGRWRLLQVLRFTWAVCLILYGIMPALYGNSKGQAAGIALIVAGVLGFIVITAVAWAIC